MDNIKICTVKVKVKSNLIASHDEGRGERFTDTKDTGENLMTRPIKTYKTEKLARICKPYK